MAMTDETGRAARSRIFLNRYYGENGNERKMYDLVFPKNAAGDMGLVLCIHGGAWVEGNKSGYTESLYQVSEEKGVAAACLNYRYVSESVGFDDELADISAALAAIRAEGAACGINFDRVLLTGISAGAHLALLYAFTKKDTAPIKPVCVVELCGPTDFEDPFFYAKDNLLAVREGEDYLPRIISNGTGFNIDLNNMAAAEAALKKYSPISYVDANTVPTVIGHGENDGMVPYRNAVELDAKLTEYGVTHTFVSFPDSGHGCEDRPSMSKMMGLFFACIDTYLK